jgi:hypothetical protein
MSVVKAGIASIARDAGKPILASDGPAAWKRPSEWLAVSTPAATAQQFGGLVAIYNNSSNYLALSSIVSSSGQFTVDWGDGTTTDHTNNTLAEKNYVWSNVSSTTLTSDGFRQVVVQVTPKSAGTTFRSVDFSRVHSAAATAGGEKQVANSWLDVYVAASSATAITVGGRNIAGNTQTCRNAFIEQAQILSHNMSSYASLFAGARSLQSVVLPHPNSVTSTKAMFADCISLQVAPTFNMASVIDAESMFQTCRNLQYVPSYNTPALRIATSMFNTCTSLQEGPNINTSAVTTAGSMFATCNSLKKIPQYNFSSCVDMNSAFSNCNSLGELPSIDTSAATSMANMLNGCSSLTRIPSSVVTTNARSVSNLFASCTKLKSITPIDTSKATTVSNMFQAAYSIPEIPSLDLSSVSSNGNNNMQIGGASHAFVLGNLRKIVLSGNKWTQSLQNCLLGSAELDGFYTGLATLNPSLTSVAGNGTTVTYTVGAAAISPFVAARTATMTGVSPVAYNLTNAVIASVNTATGTFTVTNAATGAYVSGGVATIQDNKTITVSGNPGVSGDDTTIATNKGWTVTG